MKLYISDGAVAVHSDRPRDVYTLNLVQRMNAHKGDDTDVLPLQLHTGVAAPSGTPSVSVLGVQFWLEDSDNGMGVGGIVAGDVITVVGHSLGGHLAAMATRLFPELFPEAVLFNSARYNPQTSIAKTTEFLNLFDGWAGVHPSLNFGDIQMFDSEDQVPGSDISSVASFDHSATMVEGLGNSGLIAGKGR